MSECPECGQPLQYREGCEICPNGCYGECGGVRL